MIPLLQFDPATLTLWYDTQLLANSRSGRDVGLALHYAIDGQESWLQCLVRNQQDSWTQTRCATIASAVWHEKRHFLDFVLTNYGAFRIRQFFEIYANLNTFIYLARSNGPLLVPIDRNLDPLRCELNGVEIKHAELNKLATAIAHRKKMIRDDRRPFQSRFGPMEVGGEALLEAIAYHMQLGKTHRVFGPDLLFQVQRDNPSHEIIGQKYTWAYQVLSRTKLLNARLHDAKSKTRKVDESNVFVTLDDAPLLPICYGALAGRFYGQQQTRTETTSSFMPGERFGSLAIYLSDYHSDFSRLTVTDAWDVVNGACKVLFGRTAIEETEEDYAREGVLLERYERQEVSSYVVDALREFHELRGRFLEVLKETPERILDQSQWADTLVNETAPFVIVAAPSGVTGLPPEGLSQLNGYSHPETDFDKVPDARWWWTAMRDELPLAEGANKFRFRTQHNWSSLASDSAPLAKLLLDGNRMRSMVGPEVASVKIRFEHLTGMDLIVDSTSWRPDESLDVSYWYYLTGKEWFRCQVTQEIVAAPDGRMLGPWEMRERPALLDALLNSLEGSQRERMLLAIWRDWSAWLVNDQVGALFDAAPVDPSRSPLAPPKLGVDGR